MDWFLYDWNIRHERVKSWDEWMNYVFAYLLSFSYLNIGGEEQAKKN